MDPVTWGNAGTEGEGRGGWFLGHMLPELDDLRHEGRVEVKWSAHPAGAPRRSWVVNQEATTLSVLIRGRFRLLFPDRDVVLSREGDYALWRPGVPHQWRAEEDSVVLTVRWPSRAGDSVEVAPPAGRDESPLPEHRP